MKVESEKEEKKLDLLLIRRILRWDLREFSLYSCAAVYDCTLVSRGQTYENACLLLKDDFEGVEKALMALKLVQYPNGRHRNVNEICQRKTDHPAGFEPLFDCGEKDCTTCRALSMGHDLINKCYIAQHKENDSRTVQALLTQCTEFVKYLHSERLFSILFFRRREGNRRGTPVRAALTWALIEETRFYLELRFNENVRICARPLRNEIMKFSAACDVSDATFNLHKVKPLMPANPIWKDGTAGMKNVGLLLETQVVACSEEMLELGKVWWPFTQAHISKSLQVVLGTEKLVHVRVNNPQMSLNLHNPTLYLGPQITSRRTLGSHAM